MERTEIIGALGPTNTGKTHRAVERMLEHETGMIGLPLRLLAREVFEKIRKRVHPEDVALVTGEEKIIPPYPRYWVCTVEAMPVDRDVDFLAVDEIQLAGHHERGHVFTDRLLHARGRKETWFMGADTMSTLAQQLVPTIQLQSYPRLSSLSSEGSFTLGSLPRRSAVVAFSAKRVYEIAEKLRARKGGAAIVFGGLSPRARNAQVAMYQAGEVDYLVATDAIGMGLNLDIDRVAFADTRKFDGREWRQVALSELAQIAGRAGRHTKNGTFGTFARPPLPPEAERAIAQHRFPQQRRLVWRRSDLDFSSANALVAALEDHPHVRALELVGDPEDTRTLKKLLARSEVRSDLSTEEDLRLLWDLCQIPDYRGLLVDEHAHLVGDLFGQIRTHGRFPAEQVHERLERLARHTGDIDMITSRISFTRTWNYVAHHEDWLQDAPEIAQRTRDLEDALSDDLHNALLERFVARRRTHYVAPEKQAKGDKRPGGLFGQLSAMHAEMVKQPQAQDVLLQALGSPSSAFVLSPEGAVCYDELELGRLTAGRTPLEPHLRVSPTINASPDAERFLRTLRGIVREKVNEALGPLAPGRIQETSSPLRGILYQLRNGLGTALAGEVRPLFDALSAAEKQVVSDAGITFGSRYVYCAPLLKPKEIARRAPLLRSFFLPPGDPTLAPAMRFESPLRDPSLAGRPSLAAGPLEQLIWLGLGYSVVGSVAVRIDVLEFLLSNKATHKGDDWDKLVASRTGQKLAVARRIAAILKGQKKRRRRRKN